ncbi:MAG TPA: ATP-binding domain-containing protein [Micromonosporaceae bacterium]
MSSLASTADHPRRTEPAADLAEEQRYVSRLYHQLDTLRERAGRRLDAVLRSAGGTPQQRSERDSAYNLYRDQVLRYNAVEPGLCFGRLDPTDGQPLYLGRIGLFDEDSDGEPLLIDWRAPAARPFYLATAASPLGIRRRRHIRTRARTVTGLDDDVLDLAAAREQRLDGLVGEAALLAALTESRTGRMKDIVQTIQAEQDRIIRTDLAGALVVQGGPGTGKTAVALHRAAYLLYTYREQLATRGVLIVGPNATFLTYISQVLPSLAETGVLLATMGDLFPGVRARRLEAAQTSEIKGRIGMVEVLAAAVAERQRLPDEPLEIPVERHTLRLDRASVQRARDRARRSGRPHNLAQDLFAEAVIADLAGQVAAAIGTDPYAFDPLGGDDAPGDPLLLDAADLAEIRQELRAEPAVRSAIDALWPVLTPRRLLTDLFADPDRLAAAAPGLTDHERALLHRAPGGGWSAADVPLLDEAAQLLGDLDGGAKARAEASIRRQRDEYAEGVLQIALGSRSLDAEDAVESELLLATDLLGARQLADRQVDEVTLTTAERAAADREWAFGHVIVDEAQELSEMAWRLLMRRSPSRSMTVVGDVAQTGDLAGTPAWAQVLSPYLAQRWRVAELTVNYRTPAEVMAVAADVLAAIDATLTPPRSVRHSGCEPWHRQVEPDGLAVAVVAAAKDELTEVGDGRVGVIVPAGLVDSVAAAVAAAVPDAAVGEDPHLLSPVVVVTVRQAKGLEFDSVLVVDPARILTESRRGLNDLYVALTRTTRRLGVVHQGPLPDVLASLSG